MTNPDPHGLFEAAYSEVAGGRRAVEPKRKRAAVRIKPLKWDKHPDEDWTLHIAGTPFGEYWAWTEPGHGRWSFGSLLGNPASDLAAAKAACQADFEARIRSAIDGG